MRGKMHLKHKKHEFITIVLFILLIVGASFFYSNNAIIGFVTSENEDLIGPPAFCEGKGLPPESYIKAFESEAWNSGGKTVRQLVIQYSLSNGVHPALVAAHASKESSMGLNNKCTISSDKSALTGCGWYPYCAPGCECSNEHVWSDELQIKCTAEVDKKAYIAATGGSAYSVYGGCAKYKGNERKLWNCIFCTYVHGFKDEQSCGYNEDMLDLFCEWANYLGKDYEVEIPKDYPIETTEDSSGSYEFTPKFSAETDFDLNDYDIIIKQAKLFMEQMDECAQEEWIDTGEPKPVYYGINSAVNYEKTQVSDLDTCISDHLPLRWELNCEDLDNEEDNIFMFCVPLDYYVKIYDSEKNKVEEKQIIVKFALEFKEYEQTIDATCSGTEGKYSYSCVDLKQDCEGEITDSLICQEGYCCESELDCKEEGEICFNSDECCSDLTCVIYDVSPLGTGTCQ